MHNVFVKIRHLSLFDESLRKKTFQQSLGVSTHCFTNNPIACLTCSFGINRSSLRVPERRYQLPGRYDDIS